MNVPLGEEPGKKLATVDDLKTLEEKIAALGDQIGKIADDVHELKAERKPVKAKGSQAKKRKIDEENEAEEEFSSERPQKVAKPDSGEFSSSKRERFKD